MEPSFLSNLGLTEEEKSKLAKLGASTPAALLALRRAASQDFETLLGKDRAEQITKGLRQLLSEDELQRIDTAPPVRRYPLGALLGELPAGLPPPKFDIAERDRIFDELQSLKKLNAPTEDQRIRIAELEDKLNVLLNRR